MASNAASVDGLGLSGEKRGLVARLKSGPVVFALATLVALAGSYFLVFSPQTTRIEEATLAADAAEGVKAQLNAELERLRGLQAVAPQLRAESARLDNALPNEVRLAEFILLVQDAANRSGIDWITTNPVPPAPVVGGPVGAMEVAVTMTAEGGYFEVQDFILKLEELSRAVKIGSIDLKAKGGAEPAPALTANLSTKMFMSSPEAAAATAQPTAGPASANPAAPALVTGG